MEEGVVELWRRLAKPTTALPFKDVRATHRLACALLDFLKRELEEFVRRSRDEPPSSFTPRTPRPC